MVNKTIVYLDNAATTKPSKEAMDAFIYAAEQCYGNPSALHTMGLSAEKLVEKARENVAKAIGCDAEEVIFTSGGTESDNLALIGAALANRHAGKHIISSKAEHHAVLSTLKHLEQMGFEITLVDSLPNGAVDMSQIAAAVRSDTILISIMAVNNETGVLNDIAGIKGLAPHSVVHSDCVQAFGKIPFHMHERNVDMISLSGHKIHALKGVGALVVKKGTKIHAISYGGNQEPIRSGTWNTPGIAAFGTEAEKISGHITEITDKLYDLRRYLLCGIQAVLPEAVINGENAVHILNVGFEGVRGEVLLHALANEGVFVSTGSACTSRSVKTSHVLDAMGVPQSVAQGSVRLSLSVDNTREELDFAIEVLQKQVAFLKRFKRR